MPLSHPRRSALSEQVIAALRAQITSGEWPVGSRIPTEPELVEQLGVARNTVREPSARSRTTACWTSARAPARMSWRRVSWRG